MALSFNVWKEQTTQLHLLFHHRASFPASITSGKISRQYLYNLFKMQPTSSTAQLLMLFAAAFPSVQGAIAIGNQIREGGTHFNVAWHEGVSPCIADVAIAPESERLCNQNFNVDGEAYYLVGCTDRDTGYAQNPARLRRVSDNSLYGTCSAVSRKKIGCSGAPHDVIKRYLCG